MEELLTQLIDFVKDASPQLWDVLIKQVYSNAVVQLVVGILLLIIGIVGVTWIVRLYRISNDRENDNYGNDYVLLYPFIATGVFVCFFVALIFIPGGLQQFYNPEYYAITDIINSLKGQ